MKVNIEKTEMENILALIKEHTSLDFNTTDYSFTLPREITPIGSFTITNPNRKPVNKNTKFTISANTDNAIYYGEYTFNYRRIDLQEQWNVLFGNVSEIKYHPNDFPSVPTTDDIKNYLLERIKLREDSLSIEIVSGVDDFIATFRAKAFSYLYINSLVLSVSKLDTRISLSTLNTTPLDGLEYEVIENTTPPAPSIPEKLYMPGFRYI